MTMTAFATKRCGKCGKGGVIMVDEDQLFKWLTGSLIQEAFPFMDVSLREQMISGMHPECWDAIFADTDAGV